MDLLLWMGMAVAVFWAVGAYNRLVRLRADVKHAFAALHGHWCQQLQMAENCLPQQWRQDSPMHSMDLVPASDRPWIALRAASTQFVASLDAARGKPLDPGSLAALSSAQDVLLDAWRRVWAGSMDPSALQVAVQAQRDWDDHWRLTDEARSRFNESVQAYNAAISQFPARLLAWLFSFLPGRGL